MGSFTFEEIENFDLKQTAFAVHPKPIPLDELVPNQVQYVQVLKTAFEYGVNKPKIQATGKRAVIALLDTGVNNSHELLANKVIYNANYAGSTNPADYADKHGHGTHLAGIICASSGTANYFDNKENKYKTASIKGVAPDAKIVNIKVTDDESAYTTWWKIADGLEEVIKYNANKSETEKHLRVNIIVIAYNALDNVSRPMCTAHHRLQKLINYLWMQQIPVICSGGNGYKYFKGEYEKAPASGLAYPAYLKNIIVAVSKTHHGNLSLFTQRIFNDSTIKAKEQFAVYGEDTLSTGIKNEKDYAVLTGSSQAAALLAGICALHFESTLLNSAQFAQDLKSYLLEKSNHTTEAILAPNQARINKTYLSTTI